MTERFTGKPENQRFTRGGAGRQENTRPNPGESATPFGNRREQTGSTWENIRNIKDYKQPSWFRSSGKGTLTEIRDILRRQERRQEIEEMSAFSARIDEKLFGKRQEAPAGADEGEERLTIGQLVLAMLAAILSAPADIAEQTAKDAQEQAKAA
jgi:hypothetical protein